jgi:predicted Zn-dependent peptidase
MLQPQEKKLSNGLRVITVPMKSNPTVTVLVMVEAGTKYERKENNGISHFLEHMCFKGTKNRPLTGDISRELDALGAESNAFTWYEYTGYYAKGRTQNFTKLLDVVSDIYLNSTFPEQEIKKEKGVIIEEINMYQDLPMRHVHDLLYSVMYPDQPAGWPVLGSKSNIRKMKRQDFLDYYQKYYVPEATTVVIAGNIKPEKAFATVENLFGQAKPGKAGTKKAVQAKQQKPQILLERKESDQSHFVLGFRSYSAGDKRLPALHLLSTILGQGMSSRLFNKLRTEMGVCYYVRSSHEVYTDSGILNISSGVDNKRVQEVLQVILNELNNIKSTPIEAKELAKAKEFLIGNMLMNLEASDEVATHYGDLVVLHEELQTPEEYAELVAAVTAEDIQSVAKDIFQNKNMNLAVIGPFRSKQEFAKKLTL